MSNFGREVSLLRKLVPFKFNAGGPVTAITRRVFERHPHVFPHMLSTLEHTDTATEPRVLFAEALQMLADPDMQQNKVRRAFDAAETAHREEYFVDKYQPTRNGFDYNYRLDCIQLIGAVQFWARMLRPHPEPLADAVGQLTHLYTADCRRDKVMQSITESLIEQEQRDSVRANEHKQKFIKDVLLLERDLFGPYRLDQFSNRIFVFHNVPADTIERNEETYGFFNDIEAVQQYGHFQIEDAPAYGRRWRRIRVTCRPEEEELAPWLDVMSGDGDANHPLGPDSRLEVHFDEPIVGRPTTVDKRIRIDGTLYPRTSTFEFELAIPEPEDTSWMGWLWRRREDATQEFRPEKWRSSMEGNRAVAGPTPLAVPGGGGAGGAAATSRARAGTGTPGGARVNTRLF